MTTMNASGSAGARSPISAAWMGMLLLVAWSIASCSSPTDAPDPGDPASVTLEPASALLVSVGDTVELAATVRNRRSEQIAATLTWSASPPNVVSVDASGTVVAVGNGTASVTASAGAVRGTMTVKVEQVIESLEAAGDMQGGAISSALDSAVVVTLRDARGNPVVNAPASFSVVTGDGSVEPATTVTDATGSASTTWTLGAEIGLQELDVEVGFAGEATHHFRASALALEATSIAAFSGDGQTELVATALPSPLQVQVLDPGGNGVPDVLVTFTADGDAALDAPQAFTDLDGIATVHLVLGSTTGRYTVRASVADSLTMSGEPLEGSPVTMTAEAVSFTVAAPSTVMAGDTVTVAGTGFHPIPDSNAVVIAGAPATILAGSQTELTIEVPALGCTPQRALELEISRSDAEAAGTVTWTPSQAIALAVGERRVLTEDEAFCLQFLPDSGDEYLVGLTATSWLDAQAAFSITALDASGPFPDPAASTSAGARMASSIGASSWQSGAIGAAAGNDPELRLRTYEQELVARLLPSVAGAIVRAPATSELSPAGGLPVASAVPVVGADLELRLPDLRADPCLDYIPVTARVFSVGERFVIASAAALPDPMDPLFGSLVAAANALHAAFGDTGVDLVLNFLGAPAEWDAATRVTIVLAPEVSLMGLPAFASAVDQLPRSACPSSDEGYYLYAAVPDAATIAELATALSEAPPELTHHLTHMVQWSRRLAIGGKLLPSWIAEGQAELLVEHVGLVLAGLRAQQELGAAVIGMPGVSEWISGRFDRLARFQGWDGAAGKVDGAPEGCSLFGFGALDAPCDPSAAPGAAWSFVRYVSDRFGPAAAGGESGLHDAILALDPNADLLSRLEAMLGITLPQLIVDWAAMLYADGRLTVGTAPALQMTSWRLQEMLATEPKWLTPHTFDFTAFSRDGAIVGGGTAYSLLASSGSHGALAVSVDDGAGGALARSLRPRLWVLRMK